MHHAFSKTRLFGGKNQQLYLSTFIVLRQNKTIVSFALEQIPGSTNDHSKMTNTKIYGRHKNLLLVHTTSTYVPLYSKLEHRVLLLIDWPLSSFLELERFLNFLPGIHRNAHSDTLSYCSSLFIRNNTSLPKKHANPSNAINVSFCLSHDAELTLRTHISALNMRGKTRTTTRVRQYRFWIARNTPHNHTPLLQSVGENAMLMHMTSCVDNL